MLERFVEEHSLEVHELLNLIWRELIELNEELREELKPLGFKVEPIEEVFNGYIFLNGEWREMTYPYPAFEVKPQGEVGATIHGFYFVFGIPTRKINKAFLDEFLTTFPRSYIYGSESFLEDVYNYQTNPASYKEVFERIKMSDEVLFNFEVEIKDFKNPREALKLKFYRFLDLAKKYELLPVFKEE
ncbi:hypothetical protein PAP_10010 [Palaeococcus pacificus DY20341]|uniref:DUF3201 domain-containing protein n=1 Tax=Palaeococcus pacificus DY20341 TaxID=1343739 RepID=A0A075LVZ6_9EURY|nr:DUF3201 domain-containing protein [Palaeococcus pacificus]AIF70376.1 hypothetical protein PAP_10010 [Palaeococcus pacificus DY20341]